MYNVRVYRIWNNGPTNRECVDERDFEIGNWAEIGFWLDNYGYIDSDYNVSIIVT